MSQPLTFALVSHWLGAAIGYLWTLALGGSMIHYLENYFQMNDSSSSIDYMGRSAQYIQARDRILHWIFGTGSIITDPFSTLFVILFTSFLVFIGVRILVTPGKAGHLQEITYESSVRVISFGIGPAILACIPFIGRFIAPLYILIVTVIGVKEVYRVGVGRAIVIALFPKLLFLGIIFLGFLFLAATAIQWVISATA